MDCKILWCARETRHKWKDSIAMKFQNRHNSFMMIEIKRVITSGEKRQLPRKASEGNLSIYEMFYNCLGCSYTGRYIRQVLLNYIFKMSAFHSTYIIPH